jgi:hypothetical protein
MSSSAVLEQFRSSSRDLFLADVISSHGGNLSVRQGDRIHRGGRAAVEVAQGVPQGLRALRELVGAGH